MVTHLKVTGKSKPTRRVWIDKPGKVEKRPLGIPTMFDRALQALVKLALEPEWEAKFEGNSFGFRPGRSAHDAIETIFKNVSLKAKYVLDADISQCFDCINHKALLQKLNTFPTLRKQIKAWLKSGVMDSGVFSNTKEGTPQGGVISPLLANIALHGFEDFITSFYTITRGIVTTTGRKSTTRVKPTLVRYADDFVILHESEEFVTLLRQKADEWLKNMGLELKPSKTRICHTSEGFNFLGFNVRQYKVGAYRAATLSKGNQYSPSKEVINLGFTTIIKPTKEAVKRHLDKIGQVIDKHHNAPQEALISRLNPIIRGWCNYYASSVSKETFNKCDHLTYQQLLAWAKSRCTKTNAHDTVSNYWRTVGKDNWTFATSGGTALVKHSSTPIVRHTKVQGARSPFDGDLVYWGKRMSSHPELSSRVATLLKRQAGKCVLCELSFKYGDLWEVDHVIRTSRGGKDEYSNWQLLHRHCHDLKTATDGDVRLENWDDNPF
ncbi:group II intron reverse transcriptase/maturase [Microcoleus sp. PH2017_15_JOR_U_A]|uniref:group II intron reverse transcriptase/maturase n=1 Tax=Microcoleus sp. PH2017_15_JOR_U_A TaxID=2798826 RepID=UPI0025F8679F|nr:group II intron reverse transcriptase/maturase [Microcoleus sp. PH2017_15_JOR_U_A]